MPTPRYHFSAVAASNGKIYVIGGEIGECDAGTVEEYDPATGTWIGRDHMLTGRADFGAAATSNGKIYAIGGWTGCYKNDAITDAVEEATLPFDSERTDFYKANGLRLPDTAPPMTSPR